MHGQSRTTCLSGKEEGGTDGGVEVGHAQQLQVQRQERQGAAGDGANDTLQIITFWSNIAGVQIGKTTNCIASKLAN